MKYRVPLFSPKKTLIQVQSEGDQRERREGTRNLGVRMRSKLRNLYIRVGDGGVCSMVDSLQFKKQCYIILIIYIIIIITVEEKIIPSSIYIHLCTKAFIILLVISTLDSQNQRETKSEILMCCFLR